MCEPTCSFLNQSLSGKESTTARNLPDGGVNKTKLAGTTREDSDTRIYTKTIDQTSGRYLAMGRGDHWGLDSQNF